jgi:hypothetical protein
LARFHPTEATIDFFSDPNPPSSGPIRDPDCVPLRSPCRLPAGKTPRFPPVLR